MSNQKLFAKCFSKLEKAVSSLSESEFEALMKNDFSISIDISDKLSKQSDNSKKQTVVVIDEELLKQVSGLLDNATSRELGLEIVNQHFKNKKQLEIFAKYIDVAFQKSDRIDSIKERLVDATVGARLRSSAIQGKEI